MGREEVFKEASVGRVVAGGVWQIIGGIVGILPFIFVIAAGRPEAFGPAGIEFYMTAFAILSLCNTPSLGLSQAYMRYVAGAMERNLEEGRIVAGKASSVFLLSGLIVLILFFIYIIFGVTNPDDKIAFTFVWLSIPFLYIRDMINSMNGAMHRFDYIAIVNAVMMVTIFLVGVLFLLFLRDPSYARYLATIPLLSVVAMTPFAYYFFKKCSPYPLRSFMMEKADRKFISEFSLYGIFCILANLASFGITIQLSIFLAKLLIPQRALVGVYGVAANYAWAMTLITVMVFPMVPEISRARERKDLELMESLTRTMLKFALVVGSLVILIFSFLGEQILYSFNGAQYVELGGTLPLVLSVCGMIFYGIGCVFGAVLIGIGRAKTAGIIFGAAHLLMVVLAIPFAGFGLIGPALALLVSGAFSCPLIMWKAREALGISYGAKVIARPIISGVLTAAIMLALPFHGIGGGIDALIRIFAVGALAIFIYIFILAFSGHYDEIDYRTIEDTCVAINPNLRMLGQMANTFLRGIAKISPFASKS